jgi:serine/threonine protein kinase
VQRVVKSVVAVVPVLRVWVETDFVSFALLSGEHYSESDARDAIKSMAEALEFCHKSNVVHLDMKPENVLYAAKEGQPNCDVLKLCDFGISMSTAEDRKWVKNGKVQPDGNFHGTPSYLAPEMIRRVEYDGKADVWAIGCITYILLGGIPPFDEPPELMDTPQGTEQMFKDILAGEFYPFEEYECEEGEENPWNAVSEQGKTFIRLLLTPDPGRRPTFSQVLDHDWMHPERSDASGEHLANSHNALKKFNARKKFKGAISKVRGALRISKIASFAGRVKAAAVEDAAGGGV